MDIGPRTNEYESDIQHLWSRVINGTEYSFVHVKASRFSQPHISVHRAETGAQVRCTCPRSGCSLNPGA